MSVPSPGSDRAEALPPLGTRALPSAWLRLTLLATLLLTLAVVAVVYEPQRLLEVEQWSDRALGLTGAMTFAVLYGVAAAAFVPRPLMGVTAGALFGLQWGVVVALVGTVIGAALCLGLGRALGQDAIRPLLRGRWAKEGDRQLSEHGFRSVVALRLLPGVPFAASNYVAAMSQVRWHVFLSASAIGSVPQTVVFAVAGNQAAEPSSTLVAVSGLLVMTLLITVVVARRRSVRLRRPSPVAVVPAGDALT